MDIGPPLTKLIQPGEGKKFSDVCKYIFKRLAFDKGYNFQPLDDSSGDPFGVDSISYPNADGINFEGQKGNVGFAYAFKHASDKKLWKKIKGDCEKAQNKHEKNYLRLLIIVLPEHLQMYKIELYSERIYDLKLNFKVQFYGHKDLWPLFIKYPEMVSELYPQLKGMGCDTLAREILLKIERACHHWKNDYISFYPNHFATRNGDKYIDIWDKMEKVSNHNYSLENWNRYNLLFSESLVRVVRELDEIDRRYSDKIPNEIRAVIIQVIRQLEIEIGMYQSLPRLFTELPDMARSPSDKDVFFSVRFKEVVRQLAHLARKCKEIMHIIEKAMKVKSGGF